LLKLLICLVSELWSCRLARIADHSSYGGCSAHSSFRLPLPSFPKGMTSHFIICHAVVQLNSSFRLPLPSFPKGMISHFIIPHMVVQLNSSFSLPLPSFPKGMTYLFIIPLTDVLLIRHSVPRYPHSLKG